MAQGISAAHYSMAISVVAGKLGTNPLMFNSWIFSLIVAPIASVIIIGAINIFAELIKKNRAINRVLFGR